MIAKDTPDPQGSAEPARPARRGRTGAGATGPHLAPLAEFRGTLSQRVYQSLKQSILDLTCRPGEMLKKGEICAILGVSRSPVSEALARLAAEGLVDVVPQAGSFVARLSMEEVREGAFLREALELAAVELVASTATEADLADLARILALQEECLARGDHAAFHEADAAFHERILTVTGFRRLVALSHTAWLHVNRARRLLLPEPGRIGRTIEEHRAILAALAAHDPEAAREATRLHLRKLLGRLEPLAHERPELFS
ncbi:MAG: GntR family transcriptional regulator [Rubellimicrobium sp.]|nr:GntR family transcriptional regulator [Rubellimicrobium sp.]